MKTVQKKRGLRTPLESLEIAIRYYAPSPGQAPRWTNGIVAAARAEARRKENRYLVFSVLWAEALDDASGINDAERRRRRVDLRRLLARARRA